MIYTVYFEHARRDSCRLYKYMKEHCGDEYERLANEGRSLNLRAFIAHKIHNSKNDTFIFVTTESGQKTEFEFFLSEFELKDLIVQEGYATNHNYPHRRNNLRLTIIQSKDHFQRAEYVGT